MRYGDRSTYRIVLANGFVHQGDDERGIEDLLDGITEPDVEGLPTGWVWLAGLYVKSSEVVAVQVIE